MAKTAQRREHAGQTILDNKKIGSISIDESRRKLSTSKVGVELSDNMFHIFEILLNGLKTPTQLLDEPGGHE